NVNVSTGEVKIVDGDLATLKNDPTLPHSTFALDVKVTLPNGFVATGQLANGTFSLTAHDTGHTSIDGTLAANFGNIDLGVIALSNPQVPTSLPPGTMLCPPTVTMNGSALADLAVALKTVAHGPVPSFTASAELTAGWNFNNTSISPTPDKSLGTLGPIQT